MSVTVLVLPNHLLTTLSFVFFKMIGNVGYNTEKEGISEADNVEVVV